jgi:chromosome segregation ATPase
MTGISNVCTEEELTSDMMIVLNISVSRSKRRTYFHGLNNKRRVDEMNNEILLTMFKESQTVCNGLENELKELREKLQESQKNSEWYEGAYFTQRVAKKNMESQLQQSQDRERVLREALEYYADMDIASSVKDRKGWTGNVARVALKQEEWRND